MANGKSTVTNNSWDNGPANCVDNKSAARAMGGAHPKSQPPGPSPFAPAQSPAGPPLTPPNSLTGNYNQDGTTDEPTA